MELSIYLAHLREGIEKQGQTLSKLERLIATDNMTGANTVAKALSTSANWTFIEAELCAGECFKRCAPLLERRPRHE